MWRRLVCAALCLLFYTRSLYLSISLYKTNDTTIIYWLNNVIDTMPKRVYAGGERGKRMTKTKIPRASYSLEEEYQDLFREITERTRRSMTDELRMMIDARATSLGLDPINPVDPKSFGPILEMASIPM